MSANEDKLPQNIHDSTDAQLFAQLEWCGYTCEGGPLEMNIAYQELKNRRAPVGQEGVIGTVIEAGCIAEAHNDDCQLPEVGMVIQSTVAQLRGKGWFGQRVRVTLIDKPATSALPNNEGLTPRKICTMPKRNGIRLIESTGI